MTYTFREFTENERRGLPPDVWQGNLTWLSRPHGQEGQAETLVTCRETAGMVRAYLDGKEIIVAAGWQIGLPAFYAPRYIKDPSPFICGSIRYHGEQLLAVSPVTADPA